MKRKEKNSTCFQRDKTRVHDREIGERECRTVTVGLLFFPLLFFFFLPDRERAKGRFKVGPFDAAGCDHGATKLYGARADPRIIPRYYAKIIIIDCLLAA